MVEDKRAHERIDELHVGFQNHLVEHTQFKKALEENTALTQTIADNTSEIVIFFRGAKGLRNFMVWLAPVVVMLASVYAWIKAH